MPVRELRTLIDRMVKCPCKMLEISDAELDHIADRAKKYAHYAPLLHMMRAKYIADHGHKREAYDEVEKAEDEIYRILRNPGKHNSSICGHCRDLLDDVLQELKAGVPEA